MFIPISTGKCTFHYIEKTSFVDRWRPLKKTETNENTVIESGPSGCTYKLAAALREHCRREGGKIVRVRETEFAVKWCLLVKPMKFHKHDCKKNELNKDNSNKHAKVDRGRIPSPQPCRKSYSNEGTLLVFHREQHTNWLSNTKWYYLKIYTQEKLYRLSGLELCM